jgi:hypothetical protein
MQTFKTLLYATPENRAKVEVFFEGQTFWLSQRKIAELFNVDVRTVNGHLKNIYSTAELSETATIRKFRTVQIFPTIRNFLIVPQVKYGEFDENMKKQRE